MTDSDEQPVPASYSRLLDRMADPGAGPAGTGPAPRGPEAPPLRPPPTRPGAAGTASMSTEGAGEHPAAARVPPPAGRKPREEEPDAAGDLAAALAPPRRREATEAVRVKLAPEQFHWLHLAAARAGGKVDQSTIVAAALRLLEFLELDWRRIDSRPGLASALASALASGGTSALTSAGTRDTPVDSPANAIHGPEGQESSRRDPEERDPEDREPGGAEMTTDALP